MLNEDLGNMMMSSNGNIFLRYWPFVRGIHRSPVDSPHKGQWCGALVFSLISTWKIGWAKNRDAGDLRGHYDVTVISGDAFTIKWLQMSVNNLTWPTLRLVVKQFVQGVINGNINGLHHRHFMREIHRSLMHSPHKGLVMRKAFPFGRMVWTTWHPHRLTNTFMGHI